MVGGQIKSLVAKGSMKDLKECTDFDLTAKEISSNKRFDKNNIIPVPNIPVVPVVSQSSQITNSNPTVPPIPGGKIPAVPKIPMPPKLPPIKKPEPSNVPKEPEIVKPVKNEPGLTIKDEIVNDNPMGRLKKIGTINVTPSSNDQNNNQKKDKTDQPKGSMVIEFK